MSATDRSANEPDEAVIAPARERSASDVGPSTRTFVFVLIFAGLLLAAVAVALKVFVGESIPVMTEASFDAALEQWEARGPASYDLDVQIGGAQPGVVHVEVREGSVTAATRDGLPLPERSSDVWSVPGQFEALEREFEFAENPQREMQAPPGARVWLRCEFDPSLGYPRRFHRYASGGAPEVYWRTTLTPR